MPNPARTQMQEKYAALERSALEQLQNSATLDDRAKNAEILKDIASARTSAETRFQRTQSWALIVTLVIGASTLIVQTWQFQKGLTQQATQAKETAILQKNSSEDAQWREALKSVSFKDEYASQIGAFAMQGFFASQQYGPQARTIACTLLTN